MEVNVDNFREYVTPEEYEEFIRALDAVAKKEPTPAKSPARFLTGSLNWGITPQGHKYWYDIYRRLMYEQIPTR